MTAEADPPLSPESIAAQAGHYLDEASGAIVPHPAPRAVAPLRSRRKMSANAPASALPST